MNDTNEAFDRRRLLKTASLGGLLTATSFASVQSTSATPVTDVATPQADRLESAITATMQSMSIPGANVLIERDGMEIWTAGFGVSNIETNHPMTTDMHMRIGSVTKTMTATVVLQLADEGALALDDTLATLLPDLAAFPHAGEITVRHLLSMTSGVFDLLDDESVFGKIMEEPARAWTPAEMIDVAAANEPNFAPGEAFHYSNTNYILLGMIIERVAGQPVASVLKHLLFDPLGMSHTSLPADPELPSPFAHGYSVDPSGQTDDLIDWTGLNPTVAWAAGGAVSNIGDLLIWLKALVNGSLVSDTLQRERMAFTPVRPGYGYGLGIANHEGMIGHDGSILGYHSFAGRDTGSGDTVIVLTNIDPSGGDVDAGTAIAKAIRKELTTYASPVTHRT